MEDDRIEANNGPVNNEPSKIVVFGGGFIAIIVLLAIVGLFLPDKNNNKSSQLTSNSSSYNYPQIEKPTPTESKEDYIKSSAKIGGKKSAIYQKDFLKSPSKYNGSRINIVGKIMHIEEVDGNTGIQMYINDNWDSVIVRYPDSVKVYDGDVIQVFGEAAGSLEGQNRMSAVMEWPLIKAKYIKKIRSSDNDG